MFYLRDILLNNKGKKNEEDNRTISANSSSSSLASMNYTPKPFIKAKSIKAIAGIALKKEYV